ncbi:MAG: hypothetical protein ACK4GJ_04235 [bacterium]
MSFLSYFPVNLKNFWIYKVAEKFSNEYVLTKVIINEKIPFSDKVIYIFTYNVDEEEIKRESYVVQGDGIYLYARKVENNLVVFDPLVPFLPRDFMDREWWNWEGKIGLVPTKILFKNKKYVEDNVLKIQYTEENKFGKSEYSILLKKDVGIIREEAETPFVSYISEIVDYEVSLDDLSFIDFKVSEVIEEETNEIESLENQYFEEDVLIEENEYFNEEYDQEYNQEYDQEEIIFEEFQEEYNEEKLEESEDEDRW